MLLSYRVTFLCNVLVKLIIHQKALYDIFYEKVVKWCNKREYKKSSRFAYSLFLFAAELSILEDA